MSKKLVDVAMCLHHMTEKAVLVSDDGEKEHGIWLAKSQIEMDPEDALPGQTITVTMPEWLAKNDGLI